MKQLPAGLKEAGKSPVKKPGRDETAGMPFAKRLFLFLAVLLATIFLATVAILMLGGTFTAGLSANEKLLENELVQTAVEITEAYGRVSLQTVDLAGRLSQSIEGRAAARGIPLSDLNEHPYLLEEIISGEYEQVLHALQVAQSSGVFLILDATINPARAAAIHSRAGLYLKNTEPGVIGATSPNIVILRGFPAVGRKGALPLHAQWNLEFDVSDAPYYHRPMEAAGTNPHLPLSRLYYWSDVLKLSGTSEAVMLCAAPLIDSKGCIFGVCGFDISAILFQSSFMPRDVVFADLFCLLAPAPENMFELHRSFFAGGYAARVIAGERDTLQVSPQRRYFYTYKGSRGDVFLGLHRSVQLYPVDSVFAGRQWVAAVMVPEADLVNAVAGLNLALFLSLALPALAGIILSFILGHRFLVKPVSEGLDLLRSSDPETARRVGLPEIDALVQALARRNRETADQDRPEAFMLDSLHRFRKRTAELTPAERAVFELYGKGFTAPQIAAKLHLSINTIKTHSKHIYMKLEVNSREEIALYVALLRETGLGID